MAFTESSFSAADLGARAEELLDGGHVDAYRALFALAGGLEDPNRRYHARVVLLERGLAAVANMPSAQAAAALTAVGDAAVEVLEAQPSEPVVLNYAGVALGELGDFDTALALFQAAQRLDPDLVGLEQGLAAMESRRRGRPSARPDQVTRSGLSRRAAAAAQKATPATGLTLSLCMIVRDEEEMLPRCLRAIAPVVDEIIVVDTGSHDATIEIARSFGARVIEHEWTDSFAEARNISFDAATSDWLMFLDADEVLVSEDAQPLRALTGHTWREAFYVVETSYVGGTGDGYATTDNMLRIFRNRPQYRFEGRVHEQISNRLPHYAPGRIHQSTVRVEHYGYLETVRSSKAKSQRNIDLLRKQLKESPPDSFMHFNLGAEYAAEGDTAAALEEFERAWSMIVAEGSGVDYRYGPPLVARMVEAMRETGRLDDAASLAAEGLRRYPGFTDLVFAQARIALAAGAFDDAREHLRRCIELGDAPASYRHLVGCGTYLPRIALAQLALKDGDVATARELLESCLELYPTFDGVVAPYMSLLLGTGVPAEEVVTEVERRVGSVTPAVRLIIASTLENSDVPTRQRRQLLGELYLRHGVLAGAAEQWMAVCAEQPDVDALVGLARVAAAHGEPQDAAIFANAALELEPENTAAAEILARADKSPS
jgi:glycosyltransferase involved in cell wall biosynthesis